jgi:hypothetical protein
VKATCEECGTEFEAKRRGAAFCGNTCKMRAFRADKRGDRPEPALAAVADIPAVEPPLVTATRRELEAAGRFDTVVGQIAMELAAKVCSDRDTGSAKAAAAKELRTVMAEALTVAEKADSLDELASRRLKRASGA